MTLGDWLLLIHILAAATWLGAAITLALLALQAGKSGQRSDFIRQMEWVGPRIGAPASLTILATGVWMVLRNDAWSFSDVWILVGLGLFAIVFAAGAGFHVPNYKRIHASEERYGPDSPPTIRLIRRSFAATWWEIVILVVIFGLMIFKP